MRSMNGARFGIMLPVMIPSSALPHDPYHALQYNYKELDFGVVRNVALRADTHGYDSVWIADHLSHDACRNRFECWTTLSALASLTKNVRLGTLVICNLYRHPGLIATMAATLDILSKGRLEFGIGAGWNKEECKDYGLGFPEPRVRLQKLRESVEIAKRLWTQEKITYHGKHYHLTNAYCEPKPLQKPSPPILIGGAGEKITLRIVARLADKSNFGGTPEVVSKKLSILREHCSQIGRNYDSIEKTCNISVVIHSTRQEYLQDMKNRYKSEGSPGNFKEWLEKMETDYVAGTPDECLMKIKEYLKIGITLFIIRFGDIPNMKGIELFAKRVIPRI